MLSKILNKIMNFIYGNSPEKDFSLWLSLREKYQSKDIWKFHKLIYKARYYKINYKNNSNIPISIHIGNNLKLPHGLSGIFISIGAQIGDNCVIHQHVTIGTNASPGSKHPGAPIIGDNVFIGAGAVIIGGIRIGNNVRIGANATIVKDIPDNCTVISGGGIRIIPSTSERDNSFHSFTELKKEMLPNAKYYISTGN